MTDQNNTRIEDLILRIRHDPAAVQQAERAIKATRARLQELADAQKSLAPTATQAGTALEQALGRRLPIAADKGIARLERMNAELNKLRTSINTANLDRLGDIGGGVGGVDLTAPTKGGNALRGLGRELKALPSVPLGNTGLSTDMIGKLAQTLGILSPQALLAAGGLAAAGAAFVAIGQQTGEATRGIREIIDRERDYYQLRVTGTTESINAAIRMVQLEKDIARARIEELTPSLGDFADRMTNLTNIVGNKGLALGLLEISSALGVADAKNVVDAAKAYTEASTELEKQTRLEELYTAILNDSTTAKHDAEEAERKLTEARQQAIPRLEQLAEQTNSVLQRYGEQTHKIETTRTINSLREQEDWDLAREEAEKNHRDRLAGIEDQGNDRLTAIRKSGLDKLANLDSAIAKLGDKRSDIDSKFMAAAVADWNKFRQQELKRVRDYNRDRLRLIEDINADLLDAERQNDVAAFVRIEAEGAKRLRRIQEDADTETQDRIEQFNREREAARTNHEEALANIQAEIAEKQASRAVIIAENQAALEVEKARIQELKDAEIARFDEQEAKDIAARDRRLKRQAEDQQREDLERENQRNKELAAIAEKARKEAEGLQIVGSSLSSLIAAVQSGTVTAINSIVSAANAARSSAGSSGYSGSLFDRAAQLARNALTSNKSPVSTFRPFAFAEGSHGRLVDKPTFGLLGEKPGWGDLVIPFPKNGGSPLPGGAGQVVVNLHIDSLGVGDVASVNQAREIAEMTAHKLGQSVINVVSKAAA